MDWTGSIVVLVPQLRRLGCDCDLAPSAVAEYVSYRNWMQIDVPGDVDDPEAVFHAGPPDTIVPLVDRSRRIEQPRQRRSWPDVFTPREFTAGTVRQRRPDVTQEGLVSDESLVVADEAPNVHFIQSDIVNEPLISGPGPALGMLCEQAVHCARVEEFRRGFGVS